MNAVVEWLNAGAGVQEGLRLLHELAPNPALEKMVSAHPEYRHLLKKALRRFAGETSTDQSPAPSLSQPAERRLLRTDYPFLSASDCPDELKIIAADKITAWQNFASAHEELFSCTTEEECLETAKKVKKFWYENSVFRTELDYYKEHGSLLGKAPLFRRRAETEKIRGLGLGDLIRKRNAIRNGIWKLEAKLRKGDRPDLNEQRQTLLQEKQQQLDLIEKTLQEYDLWKKNSR